MAKLKCYLTHEHASTVVSCLDELIGLKSFGKNTKSFVALKKALENPVTNKPKRVQISERPIDHEAH